MNPGISEIITKEMNPEIPEAMTILETNPEIPEELLKEMKSKIPEEDLKEMKTENLKGIKQGIPEIPCRGVNLKVLEELMK